MSLSHVHPSLFAALHLLLELALPWCLDHELGLSLCYLQQFLFHQDLSACVEDTTQLRHQMQEQREQTGGKKKERKKERRKPSSLFIP